jgi:hypothetical protein
MKTGRTLVDLAQELTRQLHSKQDLLVPSTLMHYRTSAGGATKLEIEEASGVKRFPTTELFQRQMADKLAIPFPYFERMRTLQPELLDRNVNTWLHTEPVRRMVRALDGRARALLSDRYRRLDNYDLVEHVLPLLQALPGARFESVQLTDKRMYLKVVTPHVAAEIQPGDLVQAGVVVSNSEVGEGSLSVQPLVYRLLCKNGLIASRALRKHHVGRLSQSAEDEVVLFKDDTLQADDRAFFLKVRDVVQSAVSEATLEHLAGKMRRTLGIRLTGDPVKAVESVSVKFLMTEPERVGVLRHLIEGGDLSAYGVVNAVTHFSQEVEDYDRATDFEVIGGKLVNLSAAEWAPIAAA